MKLYVVLLVFCHLVAVSRGLIERLYCGNYNCYECKYSNKAVSPARNSLLLLRIGIAASIVLVSHNECKYLYK